MRLESLLQSPLDSRVKGWPGGVAPLPLAAVGQQGWNILRQDLPLPLMVLHEAALAHNLATFHGIMGRHRLHLCPHGKTTMAPQLFARQLAAGAWGITAATVSQVQVYRHYGVPRIILANQLLGQANVRGIVHELNQDPKFEFYCLVDSPAQVALLATQARTAGAQRPIAVLLEGGVSGGRTGVRTLAEGLAVLEAVQAAGPVLRLAGVEGFEGVIKGHGAEAAAAVDQFIVFLRALVAAAWQRGLRGPFAEGALLLSVGGTALVDRVLAAFPTGPAPGDHFEVVVRSGCYLTHDDGVYATCMAAAKARGHEIALRPALELWGFVQSLPEPGLAILSFGKRDAPYDIELPYPQRVWQPGRGWGKLPAAARLSAMNDQHAFMRYEGPNTLAVGDLIGLGVCHPCTAFDKWAFLPLVNEQLDVIGGIRTFF